MMTLGCMVKWSIELNKYSLEPRQSIKTQTLADFVVECFFTVLRTRIVNNSQQQKVAATK